MFHRTFIFPKNSFSAVLPHVSHTITEPDTEDRSVQPQGSVIEPFSPEMSNTAVGECLHKLKKYIFNKL